MGKTKFIAGTILFVLSLALCVVGTAFLYDATHMESTEALAAIVLVPLALICYFAQVILAGASQILLWLNFKQDGYGKIASMIIAIIGILSVIVSGVYFAYLLLR